MQGVQLLGERVRTEAQGSTSQGVRGAPNAAPAVRPGALRLGGCDAKASSRQSRYLESGESLRSCRSPESLPIGPARCVGPPLRTTGSPYLLPVPPTSVIKADGCELSTPWWLVESRGLGGVAQAVQ